MFQAIRRKHYLEPQRRVFGGYYPNLVFSLLVFSLICIFASCVVASPSVANAQPTVQTISNEVYDSLLASAKGFRQRSSSTPSGIASRALSTRTVALPLKLGAESLTAQMIPTDLRAPEYRAEYTDQSGRHSDSVEVSLFRGELGSVDRKDFVRLAIIQDKLQNSTRIVGFARSADSYFQLDSLTAAPQELRTKRADPKLLSSIFKHCGSLHQELTSSVSESTDQFIESRALTAQNLRQVEIATEADYEYFVAAGGTSSANAEILAIINGVAAIYESEIGVTFSVTYQHSWTVSADPFSTTNPESLLSQFRSNWESTVSPSRTYDLAHLFTGKNIDNDVVGIAYLGTVCTNARYGLSQRVPGSYAVPLTAHEIGHNFSMQHDSCNSQSTYLMCPYLISGSTHFSPTSLNSGRSFLASQISSCLASVNPGTPPQPPAPTQHPPVLSSIGAHSVAENSSLSVELSATDADGDSIVFSANPLPEGLSVSGTTLTYAPPFSTINGSTPAVTKSITVTATDSTGRTDSEVVAITVTNTNRPPTITVASSATVAEGTVILISPTVEDPDGDPLAISLSSLPTGGLPAGAYLNKSTGEFYWKPDGAQSGTLSLSFTVKDRWNASAAATVELNVADTPGVATNPASPAPNDFSGTGLSNFALYRPQSGNWLTRAQSDPNETIVQFGLHRDIPVAADYDGDNISDRAVYRQSPDGATWYIYLSNTGLQIQQLFGGDNDIPTPADYDGDGRADLAVFNPISSNWTIRSSFSGSETVYTSFGIVGDIPFACDRTGDGKAELVLYRPTFGQFYTRDLNTSFPDETLSIGHKLAIPLVSVSPVSKRCDIRSYRPDTTMWTDTSGTTTPFGAAGDIPLLTDTNNDGLLERTTFTPLSFQWTTEATSLPLSQTSFGSSADVLPDYERYVRARQISVGKSHYSGSASSKKLRVVDLSKRTLFTTATGATTTQKKSPLRAGDHLIAGDFNGDRVEDTAIFRSGQWIISITAGATYSVTWGEGTDQPLTGDFDGDLISDLVVYRTGQSAAVYIRYSSTGESRVISGYDGNHLLAVADQNGDTYSDLLFWNQSDGTWKVKDGISGAETLNYQWGLSGDHPLSGDIDGDGKADLAVWRPSNGRFYVKFASNEVSAIEWGRGSDTPLLSSFTNDEAADFVVYRAAERRFYIRSFSGESYSIAHKLNKTKSQLATRAPSLPLSLNARKGARLR